MNTIRPFAFGALITLVIAGALFGQTAIAEPVQQKQQSTHLISLPVTDSVHAVSSDLIDQIYAFDIGDGLYEVSIISINDYTGAQLEVVKVNMRKEAVTEFIKEANKYRN